MNRGSLALLASAALLAGASLAGAQQPPVPTTAPVPPAAPLPPTPAALAVPNPLAGFHSGPRDLYRSPDGSDRFQRLSHYPVPPPPPVHLPGTYLPVGYYPTQYGASLPEANPRRRHEVAARGGLALLTVPDMAQVFVDGYYMGLAEEFGLRGRPMDLTAGAHRVELQAAGYETLGFSVMIAPNDIVRYRGDMEPRTAKPTIVVMPASPAAPRSFYIIPNCYAGDKPPSGALPKGCELKNLQTRK